MTEEIQALRPLCDFLIVSMHWGDEYRLQPGADQTGLAMFLAELDVDIIIGHHPHVLQRVETITLPNGRQTICFYSLGNFVSHQRERERLIGGIAAITFKKEGFFCESGEFQGELSITDFGMIPVVTHYDRNFRNTKIYPLYAYSEELLENHGFRRFDSNFTMEFLYSVLNRLQTNVIMEFPY
jgi:poly-gamma-glutamate synthesis protein (capsule biosynthesis protein)